MVVNQRILFGQIGDELFDRLPLRLAVDGAGGLDRLHAVILDSLDDFPLPQIYEGADHSQVSAVKVGLRLEGADLPGVQEIQQQGFHRVVVVVGVGDLVAAVFICVTVDCPTTEKCTGETGGILGLAADDLGDIDPVDFVGDIQRRTEAGKPLRVESVVKHRVDGQRAQGKFSFRSFAHHRQRIGQQQAVLAAGQSDQDSVAALDHFKFDDGAHDFAEINLWETEFHK